MYLIHFLVAVWPKGIKTSQNFVYKCTSPALFWHKGKFIRALGPIKWSPIMIHCKYCFFLSGYELFKVILFKLMLWTFHCNRKKAGKTPGSKSGKQQKDSKESNSEASSRCVIWNTYACTCRHHTRLNTSCAVLLSGISWNIPWVTCFFWVYTWAFRSFTHVCICCGSILSLV